MINGIEDCGMLKENGVRRFNTFGRYPGIIEFNMDWNYCIRLPFHLRTTFDNRQHGRPGHTCIKSPSSNGTSKII